MTKSILMLFARFARKKRVISVSFFGQSSKNEPLSLPFRTREASAKRDLLFCHVLRKNVGNTEFVNANVVRNS